MTVYKNIPSSFRDPDGNLFSYKESIYRQINNSYRENYDHLLKSGLYSALDKANALIPHEEVDIDYPEPDNVYKVIKPEEIQLVSYPYEWCFSQLKHAALLTLKIEKVALEYGMTLKDCSAYNIQFKNCNPIFIDTLSFEKYRQGEPWAGYRQFCQHFLAPLALMSYRDTRLNRLLQLYIDGIPLDLASSLLPLHTYLRFPILVHLHIHAKVQKHFSHKTLNTSRHKISHLSLVSLLDNLESAVKRLRWRPHRTEWAHYYENCSYSAEAFRHKKDIVNEFVSKLNPKTVWDLGSNLGLFSRLASNKGIPTVSFDVDPGAVEKNYLECRRKNENKILPLLIDLTNPSPSIGWRNEERLSILERAPADTVFALALIHHLAISNNIPLKNIAEFFRSIGKSLIIEFIPKEDPQVQKLLSTRKDIFTDYTKQAFEKAFENHFMIQDSIKTEDSERTLYLMRRRRDN